VSKSAQAEYRDSELVYYHDQGAEADAEGINTTSMPHRLDFGHTQASLSAALNLGDFIVRSGISAIKASKLVFAALDLHAIISPKQFLEVP
jgi:hypothetical protein